MNGFYRFLAVTILCVLLAGLCGQSLAERYTVYVSREDAKVYDINGKVIATAPIHTALELTGVKGEICRVTRDGKTAYMKKSDLSKESGESAKEVQTAEKPEAKTGHIKVYVAKDGAKVYDKKGKVLGRLSLNTSLTCVAIKDGICKVEHGGKTAYMKKSDLSESRTESSESAEQAVKTAEVKVSTEKSSGSSKSPAKPAHGTAVAMDWWTSNIQTIFSKGATVTVTDVETGLAWREQRRGGTNHADVQPLTAEDTAILKRVYGGKWSWNRRAIFVTINGVNYAASMNGMPHGSGSINDNNFNGHHCIHFTNSRTHGSNKVCSLHQGAIKKALNARL